MEEGYNVVVPVIPREEKVDPERDLMKMMGSLFTEIGQEDLAEVLE